MKKNGIIVIIAIILFAGGVFLGYDFSKRINSLNNNNTQNTTEQNQNNKLLGEQGEEFVKNIYIGIWKYESNNKSDMYSSSEKGRYYGKQVIQLVMQENNNKVYKFQRKEYEKEDSKFELIKEFSNEEYSSFVKEIQKTISTDAIEDDSKQSSDKWVIYYSNKRYVVNQATMQKILEKYFAGVDLTKWE
jgi:hypothetical protein